MVQEAQSMSYLTCTAFQVVWECVCGMHCAVAKQIFNCTEQTNLTPRKSEMVDDHTLHTKIGSRYHSFGQYHCIHNMHENTHKLVP